MLAFAGVTRHFSTACQMVTLGKIEQSPDNPCIPRQHCLNMTSFTLRMNVEKSHHNDKSDPDANGMYEYYYDHHLYEFTEGDFTLMARRYANEPEAHFLGFERAGEKAFLSKSILNEPLLHQAIEYLKKEGTRAFSYLDNREGYVEIFP